MTSNNTSASTPSDRNETQQTIDGMNVEQYLEQLHADYDPVNNMLTNYQCAVMEVETKFNIPKRLHYALPWGGTEGSRLIF